MNVGVAQIDLVRAEIEALKERYRAELQLLLNKLSAAEADSLSQEGTLDLDAEDEGMRQHLDQMM